MRHPAWWLLVALLTGTAWALDPPRPSPAPAATPAAEPAATTPGPRPPAEAAEPPAGTPVDDEVLPPAPVTGNVGPTPQRFDPSEKVRADFPVSFPIDI